VEIVHVLRHSRQGEKHKQSRQTKAGKPVSPMFRHVRFDVQISHEIRDTWAIGQVPFLTIFLEDPAASLQRVKIHTDRVYLHSLGCELALADIYRVLDELKA